MKKIQKHSSYLLGCFILTVILVTNSVALADFENDKGGVRATGLGGAFVGVADDVNTLFWNPAGIARTEFVDLGYTYSKVYPLRNDKKYSNYLSFVHPISKRFGNIGIGWINSYSLQNPTENTFILSYARRYNDLLPFSLESPFYMGFNFKALCSTRDNINKDIFDELFDKDCTESKFDFDFGTLYNVSNNFSVGLAGTNLLESSVRENKIKQEIVLGTKYNLGGFVVLDKFSIEDVTTAVDFVYKDKDWKGRLGIETWLFNSLLGTRLGVNSNDATWGLTFNGISTKYFNVEVNYSFAYSINTSDRNRTHYIGLTFEGKSQKYEKKEEKEEEEPVPYLLGPKDEIQIFVRRHTELSGDFVINPEGKIAFSLLGDVEVTGLNKDELAAKLKTLLSKYIEGPDVTVNILRYRSKEIYVLGEVTRPGKYAMESSVWTVKDAIAQAGFPTGLAATWRVYIITPDAKRPAYKVVDFYKILYQGKTKNNIQLKPGDIVYVPTTVLGKISSSLSHLLDPFFKTRAIAEPIEEGTLVPKD